MKALVGGMQESMAQEIGQRTEHELFKTIIPAGVQPFLNSFAPIKLE